MDTKKLLFDCIREEIDENFEISEKNEIKEEQLKILYQLAWKHDLTHVVAKTLRAEIVNTKYEKLYNDSLYMAVCRYEQKKYVREQISNTFEQNEVPHIFLKGSVLCDYYPEPWMRTSCDIDVLVKIEDLDEAIELLVNTLSFTCGKRDSHDVSLYSQEGVHIELHYDLIEVIDSAGRVLSKVWETAMLEDKSTSKYSMSDEMFYFYHMAHMAKHFLHGGCGMRSLLDVWVLNNKISFNREKRIDLLREGKLGSFAHEVEYLAEVWFGNNVHNHTSSMLEEYILAGGIYGSLENKVAVQRSQGDSKIKFAIKRVFMPYKEMSLEFPKLKKMPYLLPGYWVIRWIKCLDKKRIRHALKEFKLNNMLDQSNQSKSKELLEKLELEILNG